LTAEFLESLGLRDGSRGVVIPYYDSSGGEVRERTRTGLAAKDGTYQPTGVPLAPYGLWRLDKAHKAGHLVLVEGESDCWALWLHEVPALGLPGSGSAGCMQEEHLESIDTLYVHQEPDQGGQRFVDAAARRLAELRFRGKVFVIRCPDGIKDPADLHCRYEDHGGFLDRWKQVMDRAEPLKPSTATPQSGRNGAADPWSAPIPLEQDIRPPALPADCFPYWLCQWVGCEAEATQTPRDLAAMLALAVAAAALARKFRVRPRPGWSEPVNIYAATALFSGERKSAVFADALAPAYAFEAQERQRMAQVIAEAGSAHRVLEGRLKAAETRAAKAKEPKDGEEARRQAREIAVELQRHVVPETPQLVCDDVTGEALANLIARQGGRMLQASPEGTLFDIVRGKYSEGTNLDTHLKAHAGDPLRVNRMTRPGEEMDHPALSVAVAVQPDVIRGLAEETSLKGRGFLARFLYSIPRSIVGARRVAPPPVPDQVSRAYMNNMLALWRLPGAVDQDGKPAPHWLHFSPEADKELQEFERWLEPQLAEGEDLSFLAGWPNKLAGAAVRIAGVLHVAAAVGAGQAWQRPIGGETVRAAIRLGRDYLLPHAQAAFGMMGLPEKLDHARKVWTSVHRHLHESEDREDGESAPRTVTRRDIHQWNRRLFPGGVEGLDPVLQVLLEHNLLRPAPGTGEPGKGHKSPVFEVNSAALDDPEPESGEEGHPRTHRTHSTQQGGLQGNSECSEDSEDAPPAAGAEEEGEL
jgi:hypothetical protein